MKGISHISLSIFQFGEYLIRNLEPRQFIKILEYNGNDAMPSLNVFFMKKKNF